MSFAVARVQPFSTGSPPPLLEDALLEDALLEDALLEDALLEDAPLDDDAVALVSPPEPPCPPAPVDEAPPCPDDAGESMVVALDVVSEVSSPPQPTR
jgi:hypothetical protein